MTILDFTLSSVNKNIVFNIPEKFYNAYEVKCFVTEVLIAVDHSLNTRRYESILERKEQECERLISTLTDIKEIAEHCIKQDICTTCNNSDKCHIEDEEIPTYDVCKLILQKINEVEDENNRKI